MVLSNKIDNRKSTFWIFHILIAVFLVSKILRGLRVSDTIGGIWNYIQLIIIFVGTICFLSGSAECLKQKSIRVFLQYSLLAFVNGIFSLTTLTRSSLYSLIMILYPCALLCLYYRLCSEGECNNWGILKAAYCIIAIIFIGYQRFHYSYGGTVAQVSNAYYVLSLMPLIVARTKKKYRFFYFSICFLTIAVSSKRAGIIALAMAILIYFIIISIQCNNIADFFRYFVVSLVVLGVAYYVFIMIDETYGIGFVNRLKRLAEDGGSGRVDRWADIWRAEKESGIFEILFGHGHGSLRASIGNAHNDFLQLLFEKGIIAATLYFSYFVIMIGTLVMMIRTGYEHAAEYGMMAIISWILALCSFFIVEGTFITCGMLCQGFFLADWNKQRKLCVSCGDEET